MSETSNWKDLSEEVSLGKIEIAPEVIGVIAGLAASEVENVASMQGGFATGVRERLGSINHRKGVKVAITEEGIVMDLYCTIDFGASIPIVAQNIQDAVRETLFHTTGLHVAEVNVHIVGIEFDKTDTFSLDDFNL